MDAAEQADHAVVIASEPKEPSPEQVAEETDSHCIVETAETVVETEEPMSPAPDGPQPVVPAEKIAAQVIEPAEPATSSIGEKPIVLSESLLRLPEFVAKMPSAIRAIPYDELQPSQEGPDAGAPLLRSNQAAPEREFPQRLADDSWREPETLLESLADLAGAKPTGQWATEVARQVRALGPAVTTRSTEAAAILDRLTDLNGLTPQLAEGILDRTLARKLKRTAFALGRRLDVWREVLQLGGPQMADAALPGKDPEKLALCLAEIAALTGDSPQGRAWRNYLLLDALKQCSECRPSSDDAAARQLAQRALARLTQAPLTEQQQKFVSSGPVARLRMELRRWAAEPIGAAALLRDLERYERTALPSDARSLALDCQYLSMAPVEARRQLADRVDVHYRNANLRVAVTEELLNKLIPERNLEYAPVRDKVLGYPVRGESLMATEVVVRMLPDPNRVRMALEVRGEIAAMTTASAGPARFHNDSESSYVARKPLEIDMHGISLWPAEVDVYNETRISGVETPLDGIPLLSSVLRGLAKSQAEQSKPAANREIQEKVAAQARERVNTETRQRFAEVVDRLNQRVFDPLNSLSLDPQLIAAETTEKRFTMRLRLAGEDQLGSHTPRPEAPANSLASVQVHESMLNNGIQRLLLDGRTFTLPELSQYVADRLNRPAAWEVDADQTEVKITFARQDAVVVRCHDGQVAVTLSIARLSKGPHVWKNFQVRAFYRPEIKGRSAQLVRNGPIHLPGQQRAQLALRGIFSHAFSTKKPWELVPEQVVKEPKLGEAAITQFVIDDGWIGLSLGPRPVVSTEARRARWGMR